MNLAELPTCTRCALSLTRTHVVVGAGPREPRLMVIGEAPGRFEDESGEPFIGRSGQLLFRLLEEEAGISREECFVTSVVKCRPPDNRTPTRDELAACRPWIERQLEWISPRALLTVGATSSRAIFDVREKMVDAHGLVRQRAGIKGIATYHPAAALRGGKVVENAMRDDFSHLRDLWAGS